jgi:PRC-barrel domain
MRTLLLSLALSTAAVVGTPAMAETIATPVAAPVREGVTLVTADGRRVGRIARVVTNAAGEATSVSVIVNSAFVLVPIATITSDGRRATTSLTMAQLRAL